MLALTPYALYENRNCRNRSVRSFSRKLPVVIMGLADRLEDIREVLCATVRSVLDLLGVQIPCSWYTPCVLNIPDPIEDKDPLLTQQEHEEWMDKYKIYYPPKRSKDWEKNDVLDQFYPPIEDTIEQRGPNCFENAVQLCPVCIVKLYRSLLPEVVGELDLEERAKKLAGIFQWLSSENIRFKEELSLQHKLIQDAAPSANLKEITEEAIAALKLKEDDEPEDLESFLRGASQYVDIGEKDDDSDDEDHGRGDNDNDESRSIDKMGGGSNVERGG